MEDSAAEADQAPFLRLVVALPFKYGVADAYYEGVSTEDLPEDASLERIRESGLLEDLSGSVVVLLRLSLDF